MTKEPPIRIVAVTVALLSALCSGEPVAVASNTHVVTPAQEQRLLAKDVAYFTLDGRCFAVFRLDGKIKAITQISCGPMKAAPPEPAEIFEQLR